MEFNDCCLCGVDKYDDILTEFEAEHIHVEGVCVDCKLITQEATTKEIVYAS